MAKTFKELLNMADIFVKTSTIDNNLVNRFFIIVSKTDKNDAIVLELEKFNLTFEYFVKNNCKSVKQVSEVPMISLIEQEIDPKDYAMFTEENAQDISVKYNANTDTIIFDDSTIATRWNDKPMNGIYDIMS